MSVDEAHRAHILSIYEAALAAVEPGLVVHRAWPSCLDPEACVALVAIGKASMAMARAATAHATVSRGMVLCPPELASSPEAASIAEAVDVLAVDHPIPTARNAAAARRVRDLVESLTEDDTLLLLISGGGSAHLALPAPDISLDEVRELTGSLLAAGEPIERINTVRKHCEQLKGGRLAQRAHPARTIALIISDVVGGSLDAIASGPTAPDPTTFREALDVVDEAGLDERHPAVRQHLERGVRGEIAETPKPGDPAFGLVEHRIIASNRTAVVAAATHARALGYGVRALEDPVVGEAARAARAFAREALGVARSPARGPLALIAGGETTVTLSPSPGLGGRNQEFALAAARVIAGHDGMTLASLATDGVDGSTDAAGAIVSGQTWERIVAAGLDPAASLAGHDAHAALDAVSALVRTGPTGTNVSDLMISLAGRHEPNPRPTPASMLSP